MHGDGYGRVLGYPTINIDAAEFRSLPGQPAAGIYTGTVTLHEQDRPYNAAIVIGPKGQDGAPKLEAHLLDFSGDLYGQRVTFHIHQFVRPYRHYDDEEELKRAIAADLEEIRAIMKNRS